MFIFIVEGGVIGTQMCLPLWNPISNPNPTQMCLPLVGAVNLLLQINSLIFFYLYPNPNPKILLLDLDAWSVATLLQR